MLDFHALKAEVKKNLLIRWQHLDIVADPLIWVWSARALIAEGKANNPLFGQVFEQSRRWLDSNEAWDGDSHLGSIGLLYSLLYQTDGGELIKLKLIERVQRLRERGIGKFSRLEDLGLSLIAQGIVSAVRNPKGHTPQTNISLGPYEAIEQLAIISYLMKRLDSATT